MVSQISHLDLFLDGLFRTGDKNLKVSIGSTCTEHVVASGGCLRLSCASTPRGPVRWSRIDGKQLRPVQESCVFSSTCARGSRGRAVLVMEEMGEDDEGYYMCSATFQNQTVSDVCLVLVGGMCRVHVVIY